jgi:ATP-dependent helicase/nuclease subunit A
VLLQGVVDCALLEEDGITVVDFKTDHVNEENLPVKTEHYRSQVLTYAQALSRIYRKKIKGVYLYFFCLNRFVQV